MIGREELQRSVGPRVILALAQVDVHHQLEARLRRAAGRDGRVQLIVAYDDPYSAVAVVSLTDRVRGRRVSLAIQPVVERGIPGDPAVAQKRAYAVVDAGRLAAREGRALKRTAPLAPSDTAFLAEWTLAIPAGPARAAFCAAAMERLWFASDGPVAQEPYAALLREHAGIAPPAGATEVPACTRRSFYDTPAAIAGGQWFFAHERLSQIEHRLDQLGWTASA